VRGLARRAASRLKLGDLRAACASDVERRFDQRLANALAACAGIDDDLVQPRLSPERCGVHDDRRRTDNRVAVPREQQRDGGV